MDWVTGRERRILYFPESTTNTAREDETLITFRNKQEEEQQ